MAIHFRSSPDYIHEKCSFPFPLPFTTVRLLLQQRVVVWSPPSENVTDGSAILLKIVPSSFHQHERNCHIFLCVAHPNRSLSAGILPRCCRFRSNSIFSLVLYLIRFSFSRHCLAVLTFQIFVGTVLYSVTLSACATLSVWYSIQLLCRSVLHFRREKLCRYSTQFRYTVGLHYFVGRYSIQHIVSFPPF